MLQAAATRRPLLLLCTAALLRGALAVATITTIAGNGTQGFSGDGSAALAAQLGGAEDGAEDVAVSPDGSTIYIVDVRSAVGR
jgi:hypothetical protein